MQAKRAHDFTQTVGLNTHIGNAAIAPQYTNVPLIGSCVNYLGVKHLRDMPGGTQDQYLAVAKATGAKFVMAISETGPGNYQGDLNFNLALAQAGVVFALEGCNEPDSAYAASLGGNVGQAAIFQQTVYAAAQVLGVPCIANSFGNIWPDPGSYGTTGDLSAIADWGNAHTYFDPHQCGPNGDGYFGLGMIQWVQKDALLTTPGKPVAHTEFGWRHDHNTEAAVAAYTLEFLFSAFDQWSSPLSCVYALFDDGSGMWGLFDGNGLPRPVASAIRNVLMLLEDDGPNAATFAPESLAVTIGNMPGGENVNAGGHALLLQKSDGELWLVLWNEQRLTTEDTATPPNAPITVPPVSVTVSVPGHIGFVLVYDPLVSNVAQRAVMNVGTFNLLLPAHPILCRLI